MSSSLTKSGGGRMVKLLACGARGPRFDSRPHHLNFRDWYILPTSCNMTERLSMRRQSSKQSMATIHTGKSLETPNLHVNKKIYIVLIGFIKMPCVIKTEYSIYIFSNSYVNVTHPTTLHDTTTQLLVWKGMLIYDCNLMERVINSAINT